VQSHHEMKTLCPCCGKRQGIPIVFGHSRNQEITEMENRGELLWGGSPFPPEHYEAYINRQCLHCEFTWRDPETTQEVALLLTPGWPDNRHAKP
jgi:hypothetical protein